MSGAPMWLQAALVGSVTFALAMVGILATRWVRDRSAEQAGLEVHVTPYVRKQFFLTPSERMLYARLHQAIGHQLLVCPKVRLVDVIEVRADALDWQVAWNRVAAKRVDFLIAKPDDLQPMVIIQLDGPGARRGSDEWLDRAIIAAGLPLLRIKARRDYDLEFLRREVEQKLFL